MIFDFNPSRGAAGDRVRVRRANTYDLHALAPNIRLQMNFRLIIMKFNTKLEEYIHFTSALLYGGLQSLFHRPFPWIPLKI